MKDLDIIIYEALKSDSSLMEVVGGRVKSTCFEVSPEDKDNTPTPYIIVTDDGFVNNTGTKDTLWESGEDNVRVSIEIAAESKNEVTRIVKRCRKAISRYIRQMALSGENIPMLDNEYPQSNGVAWDWTKPCYFTQLIYQCTIYTDDYEQE